ncbi:MAG: class I SAM-dependent methyltransferase [Nannocystaceae bacterium]
MADPDKEELKARVRAHWDEEPCGTRGLEGDALREGFRQQEAERYQQEPHIPDFADFAAARGLRVLEIGVGAGTDFVQWLRSGADTWGIDLSPNSLGLTARRVAAEGFTLAEGRLQIADAERLPFADASFDLVYSYGVIHHSPDTPAAIAEIHRVLRPGGEARVMIYHVPSLGGFMLWGVHALARGRPFVRPRQVIYDHLESPGTKAYTVDEARRLFAAFDDVRIETALLSGDLLTMRPSARYRGALAQVIWRLYPRPLIRRFGARLGTGLLVRARKRPAGRGASGEGA